MIHKENKACHLCLKKVPLDSGLTQDDIRGMLDALDPSEKLIPLAIQPLAMAVYPQVAQSIALGFITYTAYESVDFEERKIDELVKRVLLDTDSALGDLFVENFNGYNARLER